MPESSPWFQVLSSQSLPGGRVEVTYSLAPGVRKTIILAASDTTASDIQLAGQLLARQYAGERL